MVRRILWHAPGGVTRRRVVFIGAGIGAFAGVGPACARFFIPDLTVANIQRIPIALPGFLAGSPADTELAPSISEIITANLKRGGLFAPIDQTAFIETITNFDAMPRFPDWRAINAQFLVTGRMTRQRDGRIKVEFRLWDVFGGTQLAGHQYFSIPDNIISNVIYERLTGEKGNFDRHAAP
jgi:TolB protein